MLLEKDIKMVIKVNHANMLEYMVTSLNPFLTLLTLPEDNNLGKVAIKNIETFGFSIFSFCDIISFEFKLFIPDLSDLIPISSTKKRVLYC